MTHTQQSIEQTVTIEAALTTIRAAISETFRDDTATVDRLLGLINGFSDEYERTERAKREWEAAVDSDFAADYTSALRSIDDATHEPGPLKFKFPWMPRWMDAVEYFRWIRIPRNQQLRKAMVNHGANQ